MQQPFQFGKDVFLNAVLSVNYQPRGDNSFQIGLNAIVSNDFGKTQYLVVPNLQYQSPSRRFAIDVPFPTINFLYRPTSKMETGMYGHFNWAVYRIANFTTAENQVAEFVRPNSFSLGLVYSRQIRGPFWFTIRPGALLVGNSRVLDGNRNEITSLNYDLQPQFILRTGISARFD